MKLVRYEAMRAEIAHCHRVDEAKDIRDKALSLKGYVRKATDREPLAWLAEIQLRAERRAGELLREMAARGERHPKANPKGVSSRDDTSPRLRDFGISRNQSSKWQMFAKLPAVEFERRVSDAIQTALANLDRVNRPPRTTPSPPGSDPETAMYSVEAWRQLSSEERQRIIGDATGTSQFNQQDTDSIEWARWSWNPITGCKHDCPYCYARDIAQRFYPQGFAPTLLPDRLTAPANTPVEKRDGPEIGWKNVFVCSMADLFGKWVPEDWIEAVFRQVRAHPQWNFLFLTKFPQRLAEREWPENAWCGTTVDRQDRVKVAEKAFRDVKAGVRWLSLEPMMERLTFESLGLFNWLVIGGATASTQTPAFDPPLEWVRHVLDQADAAKIAHVYVKANLHAVRGYPGR
jgi:protein gp37